MTHVALVGLSTAWELHTDRWPEYSPRDVFEAMGLIPFFLDDADGEPAARQMEKRYGYGKQFRPDAQYSLLDGIDLKSPGDPPLHPYGSCYFKDELVLVYPYGLTVIVGPDKSFVVARLD